VDIQATPADEAMSEGTEGGVTTNQLWMLVLGGQKQSSKKQI